MFFSPDETCMNTIFQFCFPPAVWEDNVHSTRTNVIELVIIRLRLKWSADKFINFSWTLVE
jgi:hypothetical protein